MLESFGNNKPSPISVNISLTSIKKESHKRIFKLKITPAQLNQLGKAKKSYISKNTQSKHW